MVELIEGTVSLDSESNSEESETQSSESEKAGSTSSDTADEVLVAAARNGDSEAFGELIQRYRKACLKRAMMMIRNRSDAEDEVQNAFWKAFQRLSQ